MDTAAHAARAVAGLWKRADAGEEVADRAAYRKLVGDGELDRCGARLLAGKAVGAPVVGAVAACLVISEVLRPLHGGPLHQVLEMDPRILNMGPWWLAVRGSAISTPDFVPAV